MRIRSSNRAVAGAVLVAAVLLAAAPASAQIPASEFASRRAALVADLGDGLYYFEGAPPPAADYLTWAQEAYFHYLTGYEEPSASLLMSASSGNIRSILFVLPRSPSREIWEGFRYGPEAAADATGMEAYSLEEFDDVLRQIRRGTSSVIITLSSMNPAQDQRLGELLGLRGAEFTWKSANRTLGTLRRIKSPAEIELLRTASTITREAHLAAMQAAEPGMNEFEVQAVIEYEFRRYGAARPGFASIVGSGPNSTTLHYNANDRFMQDDEMLVMDIGAEYGRYTTDITRTIPVNGRFSAEQREIYQIVYDAQQAAETLARREGTSTQQMSAAASEVLAEGLTRLGLIESPDARLPGGRASQLSLFYMHGLGHGIGLDVHDPNSPTIQKGYCFTIEPGLYIREDALMRIGEGPEADALREKIRPAVIKYRNIGVRIEDSYAFTEEGLEHLSAGIPRTIREVEAAMRGENFANRDRKKALIDRYKVLLPPPE